MAITASQPRRRSLADYLPALLIAVLAAVAVAVVAVQSGGSDVRAPVNQPAASRFSNQPTTTPVYVMYIVGSQEAADAVKRSEDELLMTYLNRDEPLPNRTSSILIATTAEEGVQAAQLADLAAREMVLTDTVFQVVDLRAPAQQPEGER